MAAVELRKLAKSFGPNRIVKGIDLEIRDGEFVVLVGPSGCGKSTVLRMIAGLEEPSAGEILIGGRCVNAVPARDRDIAMVFQSYALYPHMSVEQNLAFALRIRGVPKDRIREKVRGVAGSLGLSALLDRKPAELSGGQRQRVAMGRAIIREPEVFLFDEPLSNLDAKLRGEMRAEIKRLHDRLKTTMIYVTHDQVEAMTLADRIVVLHAGSIEQAGSPRELYRSPATAFVAGFLGNPPMNLLAASRLPEAFCAASPLMKKARELGASIGIRPEHLQAGGGARGLRCRVELVEALGAETLVHFSLAGSPHPLVARQSGSLSAPAAGEEAELHFPEEHLHLFPSGSAAMESRSISP